MDISHYGWNFNLEKSFKNCYNEEFVPGRVINDFGQIYKLITPSGEIKAELFGGKKPVIGDWVAVKINQNKATIHGVLPNFASFSHNDKLNQHLVTNFNFIFIINSLNNYNVKKIESNCIRSWETGATPVVVLTKADLCDDYQKRTAEVKLIAPGIDVYPVSFETGLGIDNLSKYLKPGKTIALFGSEGEGKTTLINKLAGKDISISHNHELIMLSNGSMIISIDEEKEFDNFNNERNIEDYSDIENLIVKCRYSNCTHLREPGCAVIKAIEDGELDQNRFEHYQKLYNVELIEDDYELDYDKVIHFDKKRNRELFNKSAKRKEQKEQWL